jgi:hypothetical protein
MKLKHILELVKSETKLSNNEYVDGIYIQEELNGVKQILYNNGINWVSLNIISITDISKEELEDTNTILNGSIYYNVDTDEYFVKDELSSEFTKIITLSKLGELGIESIGYTKVIMDSTPQIISSTNGIITVLDKTATNIENSTLISHYSDKIDFYNLGDLYNIVIDYKLLSNVNVNNYVISIRCKNTNTIIKSKLMVTRVDGTTFPNSVNMDNIIVTQEMIDNGCEIIMSDVRHAYTLTELEITINKKYHKK